MNIALAVLTHTFAAEHSYWDNMGPGMMTWGFGISWVGFVITITMLIIAAVGIIVFIRWALIFQRRQETYTTAESALDILKKRFARGEISKDQFKEMKNDLKE